MSSSDHTPQAGNLRRHHDHDPRRGRSDSRERGRSRTPAGRAADLPGQCRDPRPHLQRLATRETRREAEPPLAGLRRRRRVGRAAHAPESVRLRVRVLPAVEPHGLRRDRRRDGPGDALLLRPGRRAQAVLAQQPAQGHPAHGHPPQAGPGRQGSRARRRRGRRARRAEEDRRLRVRAPHPQEAGDDARAPRQRYHARRRGTRPQVLHRRPPVGPAE